MKNNSCKTLQPNDRTAEQTIFEDSLRAALKKERVTCIGKIKNPAMIIPLQISSARIFSAAESDDSK